MQIKEYGLKVWGVGWAPAGLVWGEGRPHQQLAPTPPNHISDPEMNSLGKMSGVTYLGHISGGVAVSVANDLGRAL